MWRCGAGSRSDAQRGSFQIPIACIGGHFARNLSLGCWWGLHHSGSPSPGWRRFSSCCLCYPDSRSSQLVQRRVTRQSIEVKWLLTGDGSAASARTGPRNRTWIRDRASTAFKKCGVPKGKSESKSTGCGGRIYEPPECREIL
jgi:hypothetical protein